VHVRTPSALTEEALKRIGELYAIEAEIRNDGGATLAERQLKTKPLLKSLESWLREKMKTLSRHSELAKAFAYALNQWPALTYYADDGWAEADNNIAENALRMVSLGRKNYLFFGSDHGGERGALLYSLIGTCKLNGVEPESYLRYVLDVMADWPMAECRLPGTARSAGRRISSGEGMKTMEQECIPEECQGQKWQMKEIELTPKAEEDLEAIWDFSFRQIRGCSGGYESVV
jgi:hypothetical protein